MEDRQRREISSDLLLFSFKHRRYRHISIHKATFPRRFMNPRRHKRSYNIKPEPSRKTTKRRHRRSTSSDIIVNVGPGVRSYEFKNLEKGVEYCVIIYGSNSAGNGVQSNCVNKKTPLKDNIIPTVKLQSAAMSIIVSLNITDFDYLHTSGFLQYYDLQFKVLRVNGNPVLDSEVIQRQFNATTQRFTLDGFNIYTQYVFQVALVTRSGRGSLTAPVYIETCHCPSKFYTNWFVNPPFAKLQFGSQPSGIFPPTLDDVIATACGRCELSNGTSSIDYFYDVNGDKTSLKANKSLAKIGIEKTIDISFPFSSKREVNYKGTYIPVLHVPGLLLIKRNESSFDKYAKVVAGSILDIWPIIVINIVFMILAGAIIWTIERMSNSGQFPVPVNPGLFEGTWWSFVTMTTIGYGDRYPITVPGRIFAIIWALIGITMSSIMVGTISSSLTITFVQESATGVARGITVGAIADTPDYEVAEEVSSKAGANVMSFSTIEELVYALKSKEIDSIVLDHFNVESRKDLFNTTWFKFSDVVGASFSYGVLLNGNAEKLERHFKEYISANITKIIQLVGVDTIAVTTDKNNTEKKDNSSQRIIIQQETLNFLNPASTIFIDTTMGMGLSLLAICLVGLAYHFLIYLKRDQTNEILRDKYRQRIEILKSELHQFHSNFCVMNTNLRKKLIKQLQMAERKEKKPEANPMPTIHVQ